MPKRTYWPCNGRIRKFRVHRRFRVIIRVTDSGLKILTRGKHVVRFADVRVGPKIIVPASTWGYVKIKEKQRNMTKTSSQDKFGKTSSNPTYWYKTPAVQNLHIWYILFYILGREEKDCMKLVNRKISS